MNRLKNYDATGVAPNGKLFAGDLNALQDAVAALSDLTQALGVGSLTIGQSGLTFSRFGTNEAQLTGALRVTGVLRSLAGLAHANLTTTQRDALVSGSRDKGLVIFNTTNGRLEVNAGTDASPNWQPVGATASSRGLLSARPAATAVVSGTFYYATDQDVNYQSDGATWVRVGPANPGDLTWTLNSAADAGRVLGQGQTVSRSGLFADLFAKWGTAYGAGDGSTTFGLPDFRGRALVCIGTHTDVGTIGFNEGAVVANRRPKHNHTKNGTVTRSGSVTKSGTVARAGSVGRTGSVTKVGTVTRSGGVSKTGTVAVSQQPTFADSGHNHTYNNIVGAPANIAAGSDFTGVTQDTSTSSANIFRTANVTLSDTIGVADTLTINDGISINDGITIVDGIAINDSIAVNDGITINDSITIGPQTTAPTDSAAYFVGNIEIKL